MKDDRKICKTCIFWKDWDVNQLCEDTIAYSPEYSFWVRECLYKVPPVFRLPTNFKTNIQKKAYTHEDYSCSGWKGEK